MCRIRNLCWVVLLSLIGIAGCSRDPVLDDPQDQGDDGAQSQADLSDASSDTAPDAPQTACAPNASRCRDIGARYLCLPDGSAEVEEVCQGSDVCDEATGECATRICPPGLFDQCTAQGLQRYCNTSGTGYIEAACPGAKPCTNGRCEASECEAGVVRCLDVNTLQVCNSAGAWVRGEACGIGTECFNGVCEPLCELNEKVSSYIGCEYWSVDLDNYDDAQSQPHAIVVTNPNPTLDARVTITPGYTTTPLTVGADGRPFELDIPPGQARIYSIPAGYDHSGTRILQDKALRVVSSIPVIAHQFNPLNNVQVYSNDGTLLIPTNAVGDEYFGLSWPHRGGQATIRGFLTVVNSSGSPASVRVRPSARVDAGPGIAAWPAGEERELTLAPGASLNLLTHGEEFEAARQSGCWQAVDGPPPSVLPCPDLTGTYIKSDRPVTVFGGHQCGNVVLGVDRCDHIESILFPVSTWGRNYAGTKFSPRATTAQVEPDIWRIVAAEDGTQVLTDPPIDGIHGRTLQAGEWRQFEARDHFRLGASKPVLLAQYMVGANWIGIPRNCNTDGSPTGIGDPAMAVSVPIDQFRTDYFILTPRDYRLDYVNLVAPVGTDVMLDGVLVDRALWKPVGERGELEVAVVEVPDGFHTLRSDTPFGVVSYGYDCRVSYAYPGGLNLETLVQRPQ